MKNQYAAEIDGEVLVRMFLNAPKDLKLVAIVNGATFTTVELIVETEADLGEHVRGAHSVSGLPLFVPLLRREDGVVVPAAEEYE